MASKENRLEVPQTSENRGQGCGSAFRVLPPCMPKALGSIPCSVRSKKLHKINITTQNNLEPGYAPSGCLSGEHQALIWRCFCIPRSLADDLQLRFVNNLWADS